MLKKPYTATKFGLLCNKYNLSPKVANAIALEIRSAMGDVESKMDSLYEFINECKLYLVANNLLQEGSYSLSSQEVKKLEKYEEESKT